MVDAKPGGREERQIPATQGSLHGQQQQVHQEQRKSSKEKGNSCLRGQKEFFIDLHTDFIDFFSILVYSLCMQCVQYLEIMC